MLGRVLFAAAKRPTCSLGAARLHSGADPSRCAPAAGGHQQRGAGVSQQCKLRLARRHAAAVGGKRAASRCAGAAHSPQPFGATLWRPLAAATGGPCIATKASGRPGSRGLMCMGTALQPTATAGTAPHLLRRSFSQSLSACRVCHRVCAPRREEHDGGCPGRRHKEECRELRPARLPHGRQGPHPGPGLGCLRHVLCLVPRRRVLCAAGCDPGRRASARAAGTRLLAVSCAKSSFCARRRSLPWSAEGWVLC